MEYFKIVLNNNIVGAITSKQFVRYSVATDMLLRCDKILGEYVTYNNVLYRDTWMNPTLIEVVFTPASIMLVDELEYNYILEALKTQEEIEIEEEEEEEDIEKSTPSRYEDTTSIDFIRSSKTLEMSRTCRQIIEAGFDLELRSETYHFSLDTLDLLNLISLSEMAKTQLLIPYHADGEACVFYTPAEIELIVAAATSHKVYHTTYYNALKTYINALDTIEAISAITYGTPIPDEYKSEVLRVIEQ